MKLFYDVEGDKQVVHDLLGLSARAAEPRPVLHSIATYLRKAEEEHFETLGHGQWKPIAQHTILRKQAQGYDERILHETLALRQSLTGQGAEGHLEEIIGSELIFGTNLTNEEGYAYPALHQRGHPPDLPARPPLVDPRAEGTLRFITKGIQSYLVGAERASYGPPGMFPIATLDPFGLS